MRATAHTPPATTARPSAPRANGNTPIPSESLPPVRGRPAAVGVALRAPVPVGVALPPAAVVGVAVALPPEGAGVGDSVGDGVGDSVGVAVAAATVIVPSVAVQFEEISVPVSSAQVVMVMANGPLPRAVPVKVIVPAVPVIPLTCASAKETVPAVAELQTPKVVEHPVVASTLT